MLGRRAMILSDYAGVVYHSHLVSIIAANVELAMENNASYDARIHHAIL